MPMQSKAQNRAMHAAAAGDSTLGIPAKVAKKFVAEQHGHKLPKGTPEHAGGRRKNSPYSLPKH